MRTALAAPLLPAAVRVARAHRETHDVVSLTLDAPPRTPAAAPGQFNMVYAFGVGEIPLSVSGDPARAGEVVHTIREVGPVSRALARLRRGAVVGVRGPFGRPWPLGGLGDDVLLAAGGIGLAPLRPVVYALLARRRQFREVTLILGARTPADLLFQRDLARWARRGDIRVLVAVDRAGPDWGGRIGVAPALLDQMAIDAVRTTALLCGPEVMMRATARALGNRGVPAPRIHLSLERNMECAVGTCGHCQFGPSFVCRDGPVFPFDEIRTRLAVREL